MIDYLRGHPPLVIAASAVALMLACALIGWTVDYWRRPATRSVRRESREPVSPAATGYWPLGLVWPRPRMHADHLAELQRAYLAATSGHPTVLMSTTAHQGATIDWSPRGWLDESSDPTDPTLGTGELTLRDEVRGSAPTVAGGGGSVAGGASGPEAVPEESADEREARELTEAFDAIMGRYRRQVDQLADDVTGGHRWLLQEHEWCVTGLGWAADRTAEYRQLVTA